MARVTVEDCILQVPNRFELVLLSAKRARQLSGGAPLTVDRDNDKNAVVALREIADETINLKDLENTVIKGYQTTAEPDVAEEDLEELSFDDNIAAEILAEQEEQKRTAMAFEDIEADAIDEIE